MTKSNPSGIVKAHYATFADPNTGQTRPQDHILFEGVPIVVALVALGTDIHLSKPASAALLTTAGLLVAFLFSVMLQVSQRAMDWADKAPSPGAETSDHALFLQEISANAGYASLIAIQTAIVFVVTTVTSKDVLLIGSAIGLALCAHLVLVLLMVMNRVYALTENRLTRARTGTLRRSGSRQHADEAPTVGRAPTSAESRRSASARR